MAFGITGPNTILKTLALSAKYVSEGKKRRANSVRQLADRKFRELENTHRLFLKLLQQLSQAAQSCSEHLEKTDDIDAARDELRKALIAVGDVRSEGVVTRRKNAAEGKVYSETYLQPRGILNDIEFSTAQRLKDFMKAYTAYFYSDNQYIHELGRAIVKANVGIAVKQMAEGRIDFAKVDLRNAALVAHQVAEDAILVSQNKWQEVTISYHELQRELFERGFIG
jgi:hypothetical protein